MYAETSGTGRNVLCSICGEKLKRCRGHSQFMRVPQGFISALVLLGFTVVALGVVLIVFRNRDPLADRVSRCERMITSYVESKGGDRWWLAEAPQDAELEAAFGKIQAAEERARATLAAYERVSPLAQEIARTFPKFLVSVWTNGASVLLGRGTSELPGAGSLELCAVSFSEARANHPSSMYYREDWRAVVLFAVTFPEPIFAGVLFHELGHALRHKERGYAGLSPVSDALDDEEVEMHLLEEAVVNAATDGEYFRTLDAIRALRGAVDFREAIAGLTRADIEALDTAVRATTAGYGRLIARVTVAEHITAVGFRAISRSVPVNQQSSARLECYRWIRDVFMGPPRTR